MKAPGNGTLVGEVAPNEFSVLSVFIIILFGFALLQVLNSTLYCLRIKFPIQVMQFSAFFY